MFSASEKGQEGVGGSGRSIVLVDCDGSNKEEGSKCNLEK
jgi:hypothetical protein